MHKGRAVLLATVVAVLAATGVIAGLTLTGGRRPAPPTGSAPAPSSPPPPSSAPPPPARPSLVVKIDNIRDARPQTGLSAADVMYVEPVEGGLTRIAAVYSSGLPAVVGPVRSARVSDLQLVAQYGRPALAYSGAAPPLLSMLQSAPLVNASPDQVPGAYFRDGRRVAPHNLYVRPAQLPPGSTAGVRGPLTGGAPPGGSPATDHHVGYPAASYDFHWNPQNGRWLVSVDGTPFVSTESGQLGAAMVIEQKVPVRAGSFREDSLGNVAPVAETVGSGTAVVMRDGQSYAATWSRPTPDSPTEYTTQGGQPIPLASGQVWVLLVPA